MSSIQPVKGTRDFYPEIMAFRNWLYSRIREVSESFGYQEYEAPLLERLELYAAKSGDELVNEQSFVFQDKGGDMIALRPELTPSLARMIAARSKGLPRPVRWWSFGPFWRYEKPQRGRTREFFQWNIDLLGIDSPQADAELVAVIANFFQLVGLGSKDARILINNRRLVEGQLEKIGIPPNRRVEIFRLIDRKDKISPSAWRNSALEMGLDDEMYDALLVTLSDKDAWKQSDELIEFFDACGALGISEYLAYDPTVIRGLDYYTGTVFEARDIAGDERAILGGGRYDNLVSDVGGEPVPGVGFAMGDVVIRLVLEEFGVFPELRTNPSDVLVATFNEETTAEALSLAAELRSNGLRVEWYPQGDRLQKQFRYADRQGIPIVALVGPDEIEQDEVTIKDLRTGDQVNLSRSKTTTYLKSRLESDIQS
ncbi:MAG: histidine--tRNA ligase [Anaerolineales bacterium]|nr:histidine--tRNA ligase [Anaerolineales bacterium]